MTAKVANNAAGRLWELTKRGKAIKTSLVARGAWQQLLGDSQEELSTDQLLLRLGHVVALPSVIRREVSELENTDHELYLRHLPQWEQAFEQRMNLVAQWGDFINMFNETHMLSLEMCDHALSRVRPEPELQEEVIGSLVTRLALLREEVLATDLPSGVGEFLVEHIERMLQALRLYRVTGIGPIATALEAAIGTTALRRETVRTSRESSVGQDLWSLLAEIYAAVSEVSPNYDALPTGSGSVFALTDGTGE